MNLKYLALTLSLSLVFPFANCQTSKRNLSAVDAVWNDYDKYREPVITNRFFKHSDIVPLISKHTESGLLKTEQIGQSVKGRSINHLTIGRGGTKVFLWSQMHGDESTATMALFDLFNFLSANDRHNDLRNAIMSKLELHIVPMLNPDGAEEWKRRNDMDIDINRDAQNLATPEARALMDLVKRLKPEIGFNLHDQSYLYSAGKTANSATISFLAPAYNEEKEMNDVRKRATQIILAMNEAIQTRIPGKVAKYSDEYCPSCFGDSFQTMGISTILIESGGYYQDPEKQYIRKINFYALLNALQAIADGSYSQYDIGRYADIPHNDRSLFDVFLRNVTVNTPGGKVTTNIGINRGQIKAPDFRSMYYRGRIEKIGELAVNFGYDDINAEGLELTPAKVKEMSQADWNKLSPAQELELIRQGFLFAKLTDGQSAEGPIAGRLMSLTNDATIPDTAQEGQPANFLLTRNCKPELAILNGYKVDLSKPAQPLPNSFGY